MENFQFGRIVLEPHIFCNRNCFFCLKNYMNNSNEFIYMPEEILNKTLEFIYNNLKFFKNDKLTFSLFKYNEPLYDLNNFLYISSKIKKFFKNKNIETYIYIHTNGDYLNENNFEKIMENIDCLIINDYNDDGIVKVLDKIYKISKKIEFVKYEKSCVNRKDKIFLKFLHKSIIAYINSTSGMMKTTKGSVLQNYININNTGKWINNAAERNYKCDLLGRVFVVESNGDIMSCCEVSTRVSDHKDMIVGNVNYSSIEDIIENINKINIFNKKACKYCHATNFSCSYVDENISY